MFEEDTTPRPAPASGLSKAFGIVLVLVVAALAGGGYYWISQQNAATAAEIAALKDTTQKQADTISVLQDRLHISASELEKLSSANDDVRSRVSQTQAQLANTQKATQTLAQQQQAAANEIAAVKQDTGTQLGAINGQITGVKGDVSSNKQDIAKTQADLDATKAQLKTAVGDLGVQSGLIATTRDQLTSLEKSGQRSYFEFKLTKTKQPVKVGPIQLQLKKVDLKHEKYTVDVYANDAKVEKKDKTLDEPVQFIVGSNHALDELVVYQMDKNTIVGYLETPKYPASQVASGNQ